MLALTGAPLGGSLSRLPCRLPGAVRPSPVAVAIADRPYCARTAQCSAYTPTVMHPLQTRHALNNVPVVVGIVVVLVIAVLAIPVKQRCGAPGYSCATALDAQGYVHYYYEVEPLGVYLAEISTGSNIRFFYKSGEELVKVR